MSTQGQNDLRVVMENEEEKQDLRGFDREWAQEIILTYILEKMNFDPSQQDDFHRIFIDAYKDDINIYL